MQTVARGHINTLGMSVIEYQLVCSEKDGERDTKWIKINMA